MHATPALVEAPSQRALTIVPVRDRRTVDAFVRLPWKIYAGDALWAPPLVSERRAFIDPRKHPFYQHGAAAQFLATRGGEILGRIQASDDPNYNREHDSNVGCFGLFESVDEPAVAHALLDAAAQWLRNRGRSRILGPIDYSTNYACGLLVEGFDTAPRVLMNHNPPYYEAMLTSWGLAKAKDLFAWWFVDPNDMLQEWRARVERLAQRGGVTIRAFRRSHFDEDLARCQQVYNAAWQEHWGFVKMTDAEFRYFGRQLKPWADAELLLLAEADGAPVGFSMTLPDFNEALRPLNGRLFRYGLPLGLWRFLRERKRISTARMLVLCVVERFRRRGIIESLILRTLDYGKNTVGYTGAELGWTLEDNAPINHAIEAVGAQRYKRYRIFERDL